MTIISFENLAGYLFLYYNDSVLRKTALFYYHFQIGAIMSFIFTKQLPTPEQIREEYPLSAQLRVLKKERDQEIADCITGKSDKFLVIIFVNTSF